MRTLSMCGSASLVEPSANIAIYILKQMSCCWSTFFKTFAIIVLRVTGSIPIVLLHSTGFYMGRDVKTYACQF